MTELTLASLYPNSLMKLGVVCRGCLKLGLDIKLAEAVSCKEFLTEVAGIDMEVYKNGYLCYACVRRMKKMISFRDAVVKANQILRDVVKTKITLQWLIQTRESLQQECLGLSETIVVNCLPCGEDPPCESVDHSPERSVVVESDDLKNDLQQNVLDPLKDESANAEFIDLELEDGTPSPASDVQLRQNPAESLTLQTLKSSQHGVESSAPRSQESFKARDSALFHCEVCDQPVFSRRRYEHHMEAHRRATPHKCDLCRYYFSSAASLRLHEGLHLVLFHCSLCDFKRREKPIVMRHYAAKHIGLTEDMACPYCNEQLGNRLLTLKMHPCLKQVVTCDHCGDQMARIELHQHEEQHNSNNAQHKCDECGKAFRSATRVTEHKARCHRSYPKGRPFYCVECDATFVNANSYRRHLTYTSRHAREDLLKQCPECDVRMLRAPLQHHILREHVKEAPFSCCFCSKRFFTNRGLVAHRDTTHYGVSKDLDRKYTCDVCGRNYPKKQNLAKHMKIHSILKP